MSEEKRKPAFKLTIKPVKDSPLNTVWPVRYQGNPAAMGVGSAWADKFGGYSILGDKEVWIGKDQPKLPPVLYVKLGDQYFPLDNFYTGLRSTEKKARQIVAPASNPFAGMIVASNGAPASNPFAAVAAAIPAGDDDGETPAE